MKKLLNKIAHKIFNKFGYELKVINEVGQVNQKNNLLAIFYSNLQHIGFEPKHIIDVGANHGTWTREALKYFPNAYFTLMEPQYWLKSSLQDILENNQKVNFQATGAGATAGMFNFTIVNRDDSCSFRYTVEEAKSAGFKQLSLPITTINELLLGSDLPTPDIIKIDAEGLDLQVLEGASNYFGKTEIFMVEVGVVNKQFDNSLIKMIVYMDSHGYTLFEITDINRPILPAVLWLAELVFVKKNGFIDSQIFI
jgi:FkbM family methyltransferase